MIQGELAIPYSIQVDVNLESLEKIVKDAFAREFGQNIIKEAFSVVRKICELMGRDFEASTVSVGERLGQDAAYVIDSTKAREEFGWVPEISLEEGLAGVIAWVENNWEQIQRESLEYIHKP